MNASIVCFAERPSALEEYHPVSLLYPTSNDEQNLPNPTQTYLKRILTSQDQFKMLLQNWPFKLPEEITMPKTKKRFLTKKSDAEEPMAYMIEKHEKVNNIIINILGEPNDD